MENRERTIHTVKQGECLASIAHRYGFVDWRTVYQHPDNSALRARRPNPHILQPGDEVVIPTPASKQINAASGQKHTFELKRRQVFLRLDVLESHDGPGTEGRYELYIDDATTPITGKINSDGKIDVRIAPGSRHGKLRLFDTEGGELLDIFHLQLGTLDPTDTVTGARERLRRLGFTCSGQTDEMDASTASALKAFQQWCGLTADGILNIETQRKLEELAGM